MPKKFIIHDEDENEYEVEEVATEEKVEDEYVDNASLMPDEISALKKLAAVADKLVALIDIEKDEHANEPNAEMLDEDIDEETDETIVDTDEEIEEEKTLKVDSKRSFGSIAKQKTNKNSLADARQLDIDSAWAKRYGGNK